MPKRSDSEERIAHGSGRSWRRGSLWSPITGEPTPYAKVFTMRARSKMLARYKWKGAPYPRALDLIAAFRAEAKTAEDQALIIDLFERVTLYD